MGEAMSKTFRRLNDGKKDKREASGGWGKTESAINRQERRRERHDWQRVVRTKWQSF